MGQVSLLPATVFGLSWLVEQVVSQPQNTLGYGSLYNALMKSPVSVAPDHVAPTYVHSLLVLARRAGRTKLSDTRLISIEDIFDNRHYIDLIDRPVW